MKTKPFTYDVNLDCPADLESFLDMAEPCRGRRLANMLKFKGKFAVQAADGLICYALNKRAANTLRLQGNIAAAQSYEEFCDRIYREDIQPLINCW